MIVVFESFFFVGPLAMKALILPRSSTAIFLQSARLPDLMYAFKPATAPAWSPR